MKQFIFAGAYAGWKNCVYITNRVYEAVITTDVGPNIIRYSKVGGPNLLWLNEHIAGATEETKTWRAYGGHSFDTIVNGEALFPPENTPVAWEVGEDGVTFAPMQQGSLTKTIKVRMCRRGGLEIVHTAVNTGSEKIKVILNGNTCLRAGGVACLPGSLVSGGKCGDLTEGKLFAMHRQEAEGAQKYGIQLLAPELWCGYFHQGSLMMMTSPRVETNLAANLGWFVLPDRVCMSTFSPAVELAPGESMSHTEVWNLFADQSLPASEEEAEKRMKNNRYYYDFVKKPADGLDC